MATLLHELFEAQAANAPAAEALVAGKLRFSYRDLNQRSDRIAGHLRSAGIGPDRIVGLLTPRTVDMVAGLLGILKAGGAYLPLDPAYPRDRLAFMLEDSGASALLAESTLSETAVGIVPPGIPVLRLDNSASASVLLSGGDPPPSPRNLSYVIYTSGSTGQPKGVAVEHRNALALVRWAEQTYGRRELGGVLAGVSICFDPSVLDLLMPLCLGGRVILAPNTLALPDLPAAGEVRMIFSVPSVVRELVRIGGIPDSLETINLGGEPLSTQLVEQIHTQTRVQRVYDLYGPTETTTCSTFALRRPAEPATIGVPLPGTEVHLLDERLRPVSQGEVGELFIGGAGVARGYLNRPELTAERFLDLPDRGRAYRTGDLCRLSPDGTLEYVGRRDLQVKIRGFRIELGEIEAVLDAHPAVAQSVVAARADASGERRLVAYFTARQPAAEAELIPALRAHLQSRLPDHMVPSLFLLLEGFALTPNGKVDREALPEPAPSRTGEGAYAAPQDPLQETIARIWAELLGMPQVGLDDDFFHLGGDSLLFTVMLTQIEEKTGVKLPLESILQARSVRRHAAFVAQKGPARPAVPNRPWVELQAQGSQPPLFLVHGLGGSMLWGYGTLARELGADQPVYALQDPRSANPGDFDTIGKIAARYVKDLREFRPQGPYVLGGFCFGGIVAYEMACQMEEQGIPVSLVVLLDSAAPDSGYNRFRWSPAKLPAYARNLASWIRGFSQWDAARRQKFYRWKLPILKNRIRRLLGAAGAPPGSLGEKIDLSVIPPDERARWDLHLRAQENHRTRTYGGRVLLIRSRCHPLTSSCAHDHRWGRFARAGVAVRVVPGMHENLLEGPSVSAVARELKACLGGLAEPPPAPAVRRAAPVLQTAA